jgi:polyphosphate glucokinase
LPRIGRMTWYRSAIPAQSWAAGRLRNPNLGRGWVGFDFAQAFDRPVKVVNDAAMQALSSYKGGKMLFLGLGTGLGTAIIVEGIVAPLGHLPYKEGTYENYVGRAGLERNGEKKWRRHVADVVTAEHQHVHVVVLNARVRRIGVMAQSGANPWNFVRGHRRANPASTQQDAALGAVLA